MVERILALFGIKSIHTILNTFNRVSQELDDFVTREENNVVKIVETETKLAEKRIVKVGHIDRAKSVKAKIEQLIA